MTERITLANGNGGPRMRRLIEDVFARHLGDRLLACRDDAVGLALHPGEEEVVFTTDGYTVQPLEFPGGDIGALAVHGTVNDLAVCGATPRYLSLNVILEEGMEIAQLERIVQSMRRAARPWCRPWRYRHRFRARRGERHVSRDLRHRSAPARTAARHGSNTRGRQRVGERSGGRSWRGSAARARGIRPPRRLTIGRRECPAAYARGAAAGGSAFHARPHAWWARRRAPRDSGGDGAIPPRARVGHPRACGGTHYMRDIGV